MRTHRQLVVHLTLPDPLIWMVAAPLMAQPADPSSDSVAEGAAGVSEPTHTCAGCDVGCVQFRFAASGARGNQRSEADCAGRKAGKSQQRTVGDGHNVRGDVELAAAGNVHIRLNCRDAQGDQQVSSNQPRRTGATNVLWP